MPRDDFFAPAFRDAAPDFFAPLLCDAPPADLRPPPFRAEVPPRPALLFFDALFFDALFFDADFF